MASEGFLPFSLEEKVRILVTTRHHLNSRGKFGFNLATHVDDEPDAVRSNRAILAKELPADVVWLEQIHSSDVIEANPNELVEADGSFTTERNLPLAILTADCLPIVLWSKTELAVVHAGWRGLANGIIANAVAKLRGEVKAWIGVGIGPDQYEVDEAVAAHFSIRDAFNESRPGHYQFDLKQEARNQLLALDISKIEELPYCTASDNRFYSHRAEGPTGRFATIAWRE